MGPLFPEGCGEGEDMTVVVPLAKHLRSRGSSSVTKQKELLSFLEVELSVIKL